VPTSQPGQPVAYGPGNPQTYDRELKRLADETGGPRQSLRPEDLPQLKLDFVGAPIADIIAGRNIVAEEHEFNGYLGERLAITVMRPAAQQGAAPLMFHIHSGGMIAGDRFVGLDLMAQFVEEFSVVCTSVEYRLAPEFQDPYPIEDCYAGLVHVFEDADALRIDPSQVVLAGMSAGGGLAAGLALMARDRGLPTLKAQLLMCPMLDETNSSDSSYQFVDLGFWDRGSNDTGWNALLGSRRHTDDVSIYASPTRAEDLTGLPPTFIDVGVLEVFRSEDIAYAEALMLAGVDTELHVWPGAFHGFDLAYPNAQLSQLAIGARREWLRRVFATS
jgi:acetyl esterase/lipase